MSHSGNQRIKSNLRLLQMDGNWLDDECKEDSETGYQAQKRIEEFMLSSLNSTNLVVLLGSGASFSARNEKGREAPSMDDLWCSVSKSMDGDKFESIISYMLGKSQKKDIELLLSLCKMSIEISDAQEDNCNQEDRKIIGQDLRNFVRCAEKVILEQVDFVNENTDLTYHKQFLRWLASRSAEKARVKLFTTNYDRCIEEAAAASNLSLIDGFSHSAIQRFNRDHFQQDIVRRSIGHARTDYISGVFHLYKLHGSMDWWRRKSDGVVIRSMKPGESYEPVLIFPRSSKYQEAFSPPYLDLFSAWQTALREPDTTLIVSGFGFADDHISAPIWSALESNLSMRLIICDPIFGKISDCKMKQIFQHNGKSHGPDENTTQLNSFRQRILHLLSVGDSRIIILDGCFSDLARALPEILGETDRQRLESLLELVREQKNADR